MKKLLFIPILILHLFFATESRQIADPPNATISIERDDCGTYKGKKLYKGPKGGCYYLNKNGNKTYVERSLCKC